MRRTLIVIAMTALGLVGVLTFHTKSAPLTLPTLPGASSTKTAPSTSIAAGSPPRQGSGSTPSPTTTPTTTPTTQPATTTQVVTGPRVNYNYGILSVSVTVEGKRITKVGISSLDDGGNFRSQSIDQQSIPLLERQAMQAQSANIQGVSGASYTSAGFAQSLQSALHKAGI